MHIQIYPLVVWGKLAPLSEILCELTACDRDSRGIMTHAWCSRGVRGCFFKTFAAEGIYGCLTKVVRLRSAASSLLIIFALVVPV